MEDINDIARLNSAGAIVRHNTPFDNMPSHKNNFELDSEFIKQWVNPFYMTIGSWHDDSWVADIVKIKHEITKEITLKLLGDFNWRSRLVGSYLAAVKGYSDLADIIGTHLIKSELCCVAHIYALTLVHFNNEKTSKYFNMYLDYYLTKPNLEFDQGGVLQAVLYLDKINSTDNVSKYLDLYEPLRKKNIEIKKQSLEALVKQKGTLTNPVDIENLDNIILKIESSQAELSTKYFDKQMDILHRLI